MKKSFKIEGYRFRQLFIPTWRNKEKTIFVCKMNIQNLKGFYQEINVDCHFFMIKQQNIGFKPKLINI